MFPVSRRLAVLTRTAHCGPTKGIIMNRRTLLAIALYIAIAALGFAINSALTGCSQTPSAVEDLLNQCAANSKRVNTSGMEPGQAARFIVTQMEGMNTRDCPAEFRAAFQ